jgi:hypothetical protein
MIVNVCHDNQNDLIAATRAVSLQVIERSQTGWDGLTRQRAIWIETEITSRDHWREHAVTRSPDVASGPTEADRQVI